MIVFPNAKINIGLHIVNRRDDGYHNLQSIFYPIGLCDVLEIVKADSFTFEQTGLKIEGEQTGNLVVKAFNLARDRYHIDPVAIHLHKVIPTGAGLGGGSSDASYTLRALNQLFELNVGNDELLKLSLVLGSDCPFFIYDQPMLVSGRGEILEKVEGTLKNLWIKVVHSGLHVSTKEAFEGITSANNTNSYYSINYTFNKNNLNRFKNDFEFNIFSKHPVLSGLKNMLEKEGAIYTSMTGSGSAIYGIFDNEPVKTGIAQFEYIGKLDY